MTRENLVLWQQTQKKLKECESSLDASKQMFKKCCKDRFAAGQRFAESLKNPRDPFFKKCQDLEEMKKSVLRSGIVLSLIIDYRQIQDNDRKHKDKTRISKTKVGS